MWALAVVCSTSGVTPASNNICRISRVPHQAFSGSRALISSMAHKGVSEVEKDGGGYLQIDVAGKAVEVAGVSGVSDTDIRYITVLVRFIIVVSNVLPVLLFQ